MKNIFEDLGGFDGAHWGVSDWYDENREAIVEALQKGPDHEWTTGWYSVKKEIHSANITCGDGQITLECSCSDDFDTQGYAERIIPWTNDIEELAIALNNTMDDAEDNRKENAEYAGFSIFVGRSCIGTLILPVGCGCEMQFPPGDEYHEWGIQDDLDEDITESEKAQIVRTAEAWLDGEFEATQFTVWKWIIRPWRD